MREILFRGKTKEGKWVHGDFSHPCNIVYKTIGYDEIIKRDNVELYNDDAVIPETVGQFTGLTDKNGKKIFEGDIVKAIQTEYDEDKEQEPIVFKVVGEMIFEDGCFGIKAKHFIDFYAPMWEEDNVDLEVIGNIHDKELLGE